MISEYLGFDSDYIILGLAGVVIILLILIIINMVQTGKLKKRYKVFMSGKTAKSLEDTIIKRLDEVDELVAANDAVLERRGIGLIQGIKVKKPVGEISSEALKEGLLIISAKGNVLRLVPPLVIEKEHVDEMLEILKKVL